MWVWQTFFPAKAQEELNISHMGPWNRQEFMKEWRRTHRAATLLDPVVVEAAPDSLDALMAEMGAMLASYDGGRLDMEAVAVKMMAMVCSRPTRPPLWPLLIIFH